MRNSLFIPLIMLIGASCSPILYAPAPQNTPLFKDKGEATLSLNYNGTESANGVHINGAYAVKRNQAFLVSMNHLWDAGYDANGRGSYFEGAYGFFQPNTTSNFVAEIYGGLGYGGSNWSDPSVGEVRASFLKPFVQSAIGVRGNVAEFAVTARMGTVSFLNNSYSLNDFEDRRQVRDFFDDTGTLFVFEPGLLFRIGYKNVKLNFQWNYSFISYSKNEEYYPFDNSSIVVGLNFRMKGGR